MRGGPFALTFLLILCPGAAALATPAPTQPVAATRATDSDDDPIDALVKELSSASWQAREAAQEKLVGLGDDPAIVERLRAAARDAADDETRQRAEAALAQIAENAALGPSLITLHMAEAHPREVFAELSRQSGAPLHTVPAELWQMRQWPRVTVNVDRKPFWLALREVSDATGIELRQWNDGLRLVQGPAGGGPVGPMRVAAAGLDVGPARSVVSGAFQVSLNRCTRTQVVDYTTNGNEQPSSDFTLTFTAMAEPKLRVLRATYLAVLDEAVDEKGRSLRPEDADAPDVRQRAAANHAVHASTMNNTSGVWQFTGRLNWPEDGNVGRRLRALRGSVLAVVQTSFETIEFPEILSLPRGHSQSAAGVRVTVKELRKLGDRYDVSLRIARDGPDADEGRQADGERAGAQEGSPMAIEEWGRVRQSLSEVRLFDADNRPLMRTGINAGGTEDLVELTLTFARQDGLGGRSKPGEPARLVWQIPTGTRELIIPFEFRDVPLPK